MINDLKSQFQQDRLNKAVKEAIEKGWTIRFEKIRQPRSLQQNRYMWALLTIYGIETGYTPEEMHADMKRAYGLYYKKKGKTYATSTGTLDTKEFTQYIDFIRNHAGQNGINLPDAEYLKQHWAEYEQMKDEHKQHIGL